MAEIRVDDLESLRHDPLCPMSGGMRVVIDGGALVTPCQCDLIARVVDRERDGLSTQADVLEAERDAARAQVAEEIAQAIEASKIGAFAGTVAKREAARIARQVGGAS